MVVALVVVEFVAMRLAIVVEETLKVAMVEEPVETKPLGIKIILVVEVGARYPAASTSQAWPNEAPLSVPQTKFPFASVSMVLQFINLESWSPPFSIWIPFAKVDVAVVELTSKDEVTAKPP